MYNFWLLVFCADMAFWPLQLFGELMLKTFVFALRAVLPAAPPTVVGGAASATVVTLGEQDFSDGPTVALLEYNPAQSGEPAPAVGGLNGRAAHHRNPREPGLRRGNDRSFFDRR